MVCIHTPMFCPNHPFGHVRWYSTILHPTIAPFLVIIPIIFHIPWWFSHDFAMKCQLLRCFQWFSHELPIFPWVFQGCSHEIHHFSWLFHAFPMKATPKPGPFSGQAKTAADFAHQAAEAAETARQGRQGGNTLPLTKSIAHSAIVPRRGMGWDFPWFSSMKHGDFPHFSIYLVNSGGFNSG